MESTPQWMRATMNVTHIRALRAVVEHGSLSAAAKELGYTTSAISQQISALEKDMDVSLFERGPRSLRVTAAGQRMYELSGDILEHIASVADIMRGYSAAEEGTLRLTATGSAAAALLPRAVAGICAVHPAATVGLVAPGGREDVVGSVRDGLADVGVVYEYSARPESDLDLDGLVRTDLLEEEMVVIGRDQGESGMRESLADFTEPDWLSGSQGSIQDQLLRQLGEEAGFTPNIRHRSDDPDVIRGLVNQGLGIALVPVLSLGVDRNIHLYRLRRVPAHRTVIVIHRATDLNPLISVALEAFRLAAADYLRWSRTAFEVKYPTPMLTLGSELQTF